MADSFAVPEWGHKKIVHAKEKLCKAGYREVQLISVSCPDAVVRLHWVISLDVEVEKYFPFPQYRHDCVKISR